MILQGDDIFLDHLPEPSRGQTIELCRGLVDHVDHFIVNSQFYADKMGQMFAVPENKLRITPLSIDLTPFAGVESGNEVRPTNFDLVTWRRIAPEKGLHHLVDAFIQLASRPEHRDLSLHVAGWLGSINHGYLQSLTAKIAAAGLADRFTYHGSPDLAEKVSLLRSLHLLSVPTDYEEPKGLFVLEALAAGVPVVQPNHGAFGELIASTGGGLLVPPDDVAALCESIQRLKDDPKQRERLGSTGKTNVTQKHSIIRAAEQLSDLLSGSGHSDWMNLRRIPSRRIVNCRSMVFPPTNWLGTKLLPSNGTSTRTVTSATSFLSFEGVTRTSTLDNPRELKIRSASPRTSSAVAPGMIPVLAPS